MKVIKILAIIIISVIIIIFIGLTLFTFYFKFDSEPIFLGEFVDKSNLHTYKMVLIDQGAISGTTYFQISTKDSNKRQKIYNFSSYIYNDSINIVSNMYIGSGDTVKVSFRQRGKDTTILFVSGKLIL